MNEYFSFLLIVVFFSFLLLFWHGQKYLKSRRIIVKINIQDKMVNALKCYKFGEKV